MYRPIISLGRLKALITLSSLNYEVPRLVNHVIGSDGQVHQMFSWMLTVLYAVDARRRESRIAARPISTE